MKKYLIIMTTVFVLSGCVATITPIGPPPPPPPQAEVITVAPWYGAVWVGGVWVWHPRYHRYFWRHGHWR